MSYRLKTLIRRASLLRRRLDIERQRHTPNLRKLVKLQKLHVVIKRKISNFDPPSPKSPSAMAMTA